MSLYFLYGILLTFKSKKKGRVLEKSVPNDVVFA